MKKILKMPQNTIWGIFFRFVVLDFLKSNVFDILTYNDNIPKLFFTTTS